MKNADPSTALWTDEWEATGVYWKPVWHILADGDFELLLANAGVPSDKSSSLGWNAAHVKNLPDRKTDVKDAEWLADLLAHGLIRASFVPDQPTQQMRDLLRTRKQLVGERIRHTQRIQKTLEDANIKLDTVVTNILGLTGRRILQRLIDGETVPQALAALAHRNIQASRDQLEAALRGHVTPHHRFLLKLHLDQIDALDAAIASIDKEVEGHLEPFRAAVELLSAIPGVSQLSARVILSEIGLDMSRFETAGHLVSWAGLCPRNDESAGKRRSTRLRQGAPWLKTILVQCGWAAMRAKGSYFQAQYYRLRSRRGSRKAICAVAASLLTTAYHMLKNGACYQDLGANHFDQRSKTKHVQRLVNRLETLGYDVKILSKAA
jgi:transposase